MCSINFFMHVFQVLVLRNNGILACGESIDEAFFFAKHIMAAVEAQVSPLTNSRCAVYWLVLRFSALLDCLLFSLRNNYLLFLLISVTTLISGGAVL